MNSLIHFILLFSASRTMVASFAPPRRFTTEGREWKTLSSDIVLAHVTEVDGVHVPYSFDYDTERPRAKYRPAPNSTRHSFYLIAATTTLLLVTKKGLTRLPLSQLGLVSVGVPYLLGLVWSLRSAFSVGSRKSLVSNGHRIAGAFTLVLPLILAGLQMNALEPVPVILYSTAIGATLVNLLMGAAMIKTRVPAYDIPTLRAIPVLNMMAYFSLNPTLGISEFLSMVWLRI